MPNHRLDQLRGLSVEWQTRTTAGNVRRDTAIELANAAAELLAEVDRLRRKPTHRGRLPEHNYHGANGMDYCRRCEIDRENRAP
jgi:hypothetical protein